MEAFRRSIKIAVLSSRGIVDDELVEKSSELDKAIAKLAGRSLSKALLLVFYYAYHCHKSWEEIAQILYDRHDKEYSVKTLMDYGSKIERIIGALAESSKEIQAWETITQP
ncbi:MAG: hypothetical protein OEY67_09630 [Gammaproteobacteria bacterium]|nr:hypothetical protein [Gammaproteobacteria bacterium]